MRSDWEWSCYGLGMKVVGMGEMSELVGGLRKGVKGWPLMER